MIKPTRSDFDYRFAILFCVTSAALNSNITPESVGTNVLAGTFSAYKIGKMVHVNAALGSAMNLQAGSSYVIAHGLPAPKDGPIIITGRIYYGQTTYPEDFSVYSDGVLKLKANKTGKYGFAIDFSYICS